MKDDHYDERDYAVVLDKPGARLDGATVYGRVLVKDNGCTVSAVELKRPDVVRSLAVPGAFALGALLGGIVWRWAR